MGVWFIAIPEGAADEFVCCKTCNTPFVNKSNINLDLVVYGKCSDVVNVIHGPARHTEVFTGEYYISDITCKRCNTEIGWFYEFASSPSQMHKENTFVLVMSNVNIN
eukprot:scpid88131/ scgid30637/ Protein yippee-like 5 &gt; Protein yippee-like 5 &gt; Protein yippee-like 5 &gt; Protein yippee-like 5 &gt; Protein yippee-like 5